MYIGLAGTSLSDNGVYLSCSVVAITGVSQSTTIAIILVSKHCDDIYHYESLLK